MQYGTCCVRLRNSWFSCTNLSYITLLGGGCRSGSDSDAAISDSDAVPSALASVAGVAVYVFPLLFPFRPPCPLPLPRRDPFEYSDPLPTGALVLPEYCPLPLPLVMRPLPFVLP